MSGIVRLCLSFFPRIAFFLARSLSNLLSYFLFFCSTSLVLLPQISLLLTALLHPPRCKALRVPQSKKKKNDCRFFVAFFTSRFSRCKQVFLCATSLNFVCHFSLPFLFFWFLFGFPRLFCYNSLCFLLFISSSLFTFWCGEIIVLNGDWLSPRTTPARARPRTAGQVEELEEEREERREERFRLAPC